jgi:hypothetical protein
MFVKSVCCCVVYNIKQLKNNGGAHSELQFCV